MGTLCYGCFEKHDETLPICPHCGYMDVNGPEEALHLEPGCLLRDTYIVGKVLGYGGFGVTYLGWNTVLEQKVAIKEYLPSEFSTRMPGHTLVTVFNGEKSDQFHDGAEKFVDEANQLAQFRNTDGIIHIYESFYENNTAYIIMEYLNGQTLTKYLEKSGLLPADEAVRLLTPIIQSLQVIHKNNIIHRDIAPDNIMVTDDGQVKLIDFGAARYATTSRSRSLTVVIKPGYSPEEQYRSRGDQGPWTDVYAVSATLYKMITGHTPPDAMERRAFFESRKKDILVPVTKYTKKINNNQEMAIRNAMNVRIEDRTPDMTVFEQELSAQEEVKRRYGNIKKIDKLTWPLWLKIVLPFAACALATVAALFVFGIIGFTAGLKEDSTIPDGMVKVPSVIGSEIEKAEIRIKDQLVLIIAGKEESDEIPANLILSQDLAAGSIVRRNTELRVIISAGTESDTVQTDETGKVALVDVQYRSIDVAVRLLELLGVAVNIIEEFSDTVASGVVITQDPVAGTVLDPGTEVTLVVSKDDVPIGNNDGDIIEVNQPATAPQEANKAPEAPKKDLNRIEVSPPTKVFYNLGEPYDPSGMVVTAHYSDNSTRDVTRYCATRGFNSSTAGEKTVIITYSENGIRKTAEFMLTVYNIKVLVGIEATPPTNTTYYLGSTDFDTEGLVVTAIYSDGSTSDITHLYVNDPAATEGFIAYPLGLVPVTLKYEENGILVYAYITIEVVEDDN